jgi:hypothetical protein
LRRGPLASVVAGALAAAPLGCTGAGDDGTASATTVLDTDALLDDCVSAASALASELYDGERQCATVIRFAHDDLDVRGWQVVCGPQVTVAEAEARAVAADIAGIGEAAALLGPQPAQDAYVFYEAPAPEGRVAMVSARNGAGFLGARFGGAGELLHPATWRDPEPLREGCPPWEDLPAPWVVDLVDPDVGEGTTTGGDETTTTDGDSTTAGADAGRPRSAEVDAVMTALASTVAPAAVTANGLAHAVLILRYTPTLEPSQAAGAEWIVTILGGPFQP